MLIPINLNLKKFVLRFEEQELAKDGQYTWYNDDTRASYVTCRNRFLSGRRYNRKRAKKSNVDDY